MQFAVIGLGNFGFHVAETLSQLGGEVIAIDKDEAIIEQIKDKVAQAVIADATQEKALRSLGIPDVDTAVVAVGDMDASIMTTVLLRRIGVSKIIARALSEIHERVLDEVGASRIIYVEHQMAEQLVKQLLAPHVLQHMTFPGGYSLVEMKTHKAHVNKTIVELDFRKQYAINIIAIQKRIPAVDENGKSFFKQVTNTQPRPDDIISEDDILVLVGGTENINFFLEKESP
jgi:trk system potassium uptake protein TrkA